MAMQSPKFPAPRHISPEAQAILETNIDMGGLAEPLPQTTDQWLALIKSSNQKYSPSLQYAISSDAFTVEQKIIAGVTVRIITPNHIPDDRKDKVLINLHGGGYVMLGGEFSALEGIGLALAGGFKVIAVDYRMPPLHPFPAAVDDGFAVYQDLLQNYSANDIAIFGSSAGGGLTAAVVLAIRDAGLPMPKALVLNTPWSDLNKIGDSYFTNHGVDPILSSYDGGLGQMALLYAGDQSLDHPLLSPVYADYSQGFPPTLLISGTRDLLLSCTVRLHRALRAENIEAELHIFEAMWHGFMTVPEGHEANTESVHFLKRHFGLSS